MKDGRKEVAGAHANNIHACAYIFVHVHICTRKCVQGRKQGKKKIEKKEGRKEERKKGRDVPKLSHAGGTIF